MKQQMFLLIAGCLVMAARSNAQKPANAADTTKKAGPAKVADKVKSSRKVEGLLTMYQDTSSGSVQLYVKKDQLGKEFIYQSYAMGGPAELFLNQSMPRTTWIFKIRKSYDKLEFAQVNTNFYYDSSNAVSKAANVDVSEAVFFADKIAAEDSAGYLIGVDGLFLSDKLDPIKPVVPPSVPPTLVYNLGTLNPAKSRYDKIRSFPDNTDVIVELAFDNPAPFNPGGKDITDPRYNRIRFQHSFLLVPQNDYTPRRDDPRIGFFSTQQDDMTSKSPTPYHDFIHRWNLKKKDPTAALSEPVEPIVFWVENTTPVELRQIILDAGMKWNEAFEKAGFKNALVMKMMPDTATWDPADIRYNVIRWVSSNLGYANGPSVENPKTGQILGADITIDWGFMPFTAAEEELFSASGEPKDLESSLPTPPFWRSCIYARESKMQLAVAQTALDAEGADPGQLGELQKEYYTELVMHEMGHCLGLMHNMKASQMLSPAELKDKKITDEWGVMGSVMDYSAVNLSLDPSQQAGYYTNHPGPYDKWAIEYGYREFSPAEEKAGLDKILSRSKEPKLAFGNDADITGPGRGIDPRVITWDMSNDMVTYADERYRLVNRLMPKLKDRYTLPGQSYSELIERYNILQGQRITMAFALSRYIGGIYVDRTFPEQQSGNKPFTPVPADYQKKALGVLNKYVFSPGAYDADRYLFPYLQTQRRGFDFFTGTEDPKPANFVLRLQASLLQFWLNPVTLRRINSTTLYGNAYSVADLFGDLTRDFFHDDLTTNVNLYRQNLQAEYVKRLAALLAATDGMYDYPSVAASFSALKKIKGLLATAVSTDEATKAHRATLVFLIDKATTVK